jgi:N-acetyl-anhydromuramyl-L-alanine amidase AmpD
MIPSLDTLPAKPQRIILHWTGGSYTPNAVDRASYHYLIDGNGEVHAAVPVERNMVSPAPPDRANHTLNFNTGSVGVAFCAMGGKEVREKGPYGKWPLKRAQVIAGCTFVAELLDTWRMPCTVDTVFTHAEAQRIHGVKQNNKWDIDVFPWSPHLNPRECGSMLRDWIADAMYKPSYPFADVATVDLIQRPEVQPMALPTRPQIPALPYTGHAESLNRRSVARIANEHSVHPDVAIESAPVLAEILARFRESLPLVARQLVAGPLRALEDRLRGL